MAQNRDVIVTTDDSGRSMSAMLGTLIVVAALIVGIWYFATQNDGAGDSTGITVEVQPGE